MNAEAIVIKKRRQGTSNKIPAAVVLFEMPKRKVIETGAGSSFIDVFTTKEIKDSCSVQGHGRVLAVSKETLDLLLAQYYLNEGA